MTDRLAPADAGYLYTEDATTPMHVGGVAILNPGSRRGARFDYNRIVDLIESRLSLVPRYRQKVRTVPGRFARPVWVDDPEFDFGYHVRRSTIPKPGSDAQLAELVSRLMSRPLDRNRPLWEVYIVEGLAGGRVALINKTHLSMVDRVGAVDVAAAILDLTPEPREVPTEVWTPVPPPSDIDLVVDAVSDITRRPTEILDAVRLAGLDVRATLTDLSEGIGVMWRTIHRAIRPAPPSPLNVTATGQRRFMQVGVDLSRLKQIRAAHGGTVNDAIVAVITGALRAFLLSRGEPVTPGTTLRAMIPMSIRIPPSEATVSSGEAGAKVTSFLLDLPVSEPNPVVRLHQVSFAMAAHTESAQGISADTLMAVGQFAPGTLQIQGARVGAQLGRRLYNLMITNVPGPQVQLYAAGIPVVAMYSVSPLAHGQALTLSVTSYLGQVYFGITADKEAIPDLDEFGTLIQEAIDEFPRAARTIDPTRTTASTRTTPMPRTPRRSPATSDSSATAAVAKGPTGRRRGPAPASGTTATAGQADEAAAPPNSPESASAAPKGARRPKPAPKPVPARARAIPPPTEGGPA